MTNSIDRNQNLENRVIKRDISTRANLIFTFLFGSVVVVIVKILLIQINEGSKLRAMSMEKYTVPLKVFEKRGNIYAENGALLSSSIYMYDGHIDFSVIDSSLFAKDIDSLTKCLSTLFQDKTSKAIKEKLVKSYNNVDQYYLLGKNFTEVQYYNLKAFPILNKGQYRGGFITNKFEKRKKQFDLLASRTIGNFRDSNMTGLESYYNKFLYKINDSLGSENWDIISTIDIKMQCVAEKSLKAILQSYECMYGTCIVMEVSTGKIRALANLGRQPNGNYLEDMNYAVVPTEPGSTFKLVTLLSLLTDKFVTVDSEVDAEGGAIMFGNKVMKDSHLGLHIMPIWKAFAESSMTAFAKLVYTYYHDKPSQFVNHLTELKLDEPTGVDILGERRAIITRPGNIQWDNTSLPWMAIGYGVQLTPLQTCMLYNAIANNGKMMKPYLVSAIREYGKNKIETHPEVVATVGSPSVISQVQKCLRADVTEGTAKGIESQYYTICGKTGTAQVADKGISYSDGVYQGSFVGYFPADKPQYTICVLIRTKPHSLTYYGGAIAAPIFRMVADAIFVDSTYHIPTDTLNFKTLGGIDRVRSLIDVHEKD